METTETTEPTTPRTLEQIIGEYRPLAAQLGQVTYEFEQRKADLMDKMAKLNNEASDLKTPADSVN